LKGPRGLELRPTGDRLKETLFDILAPVVADSVFIDAFAGTGAIGIEALSRGARQVVFIESAAQGLSLIRQNLQTCGITTAFRVLDRDVFQALRFLGREGFRSDLIYFDPPYHWTAYRDLLENVTAASLLSSRGRIVVEHHRRAAVPEAGRGYGLRRRVRQGDQCLSFYGAPEAEPAGFCGP